MQYLSLRLENCDPDELLAVIDGTDVQHRVLPGGELRAEVEQLHLGGSVLHRGFYGMKILADGAMPAGMISVGIVTSKQADAVVNGLICPPLSIQLYSEGSELTYRAEPGNGWFAYCVERDRIQSAALRLFGRPLPIPYKETVSIDPAKTDGLRVAATIEALFALGTYPQPGATIEHLAKQLEEQLVFELASAVNNRRHPDSSPESRGVHQRRRLMARAEDYLRANLSEPFNLSDFAAATGTNHRTLQRHFRSVYGVTPQVWFRSMKLNAIRRELQQSSRTGERVSDIAMRWGFLHLGRFAEEYRELFGERPRDTLRC
jgi:AraC family ethanolamine operon transcriptional activator